MKVCLSCESSLNVWSRNKIVLAERPKKRIRREVAQINSNDRADGTPQHLPQRQNFDIDFAMDQDPDMVRKITVYGMSQGLRSSIHHIRPPFLMKEKEDRQR